MKFLQSGAVGALLTDATLRSVLSDIRHDLPRARYRGFRRAWIVNNLIRGPAKRHRMQKRVGYALPGTINVSLTERCNLRCRGCYASAYARNREMSVAEFESILDQARALGTYLVGILGGEPLLRRDMLPVLVRHSDIAFRVSTNGCYVDDEVVSTLRCAGNIVLYFSLEGPQQHTDWWRGDGIYDRVEHAMLRLRDEHILFGFSVCLHAGNAEAVVSDEFIGRMRELGNRTGLFFPYGPVGSRYVTELSLNPSSKRQLYACLDGLAAKHRMLLIEEGACAPDKGRRHPLNQGCSAGKSIHITPDGNVEPCNAIQFAGGNVFERSLSEVVALPFYQALHTCAQSQGGQCIGSSIPEQVLTIIDRYHAQPTNPAAMASLQRCIAAFGSHPVSAATALENTYETAR